MILRSVLTVCALAVTALLVVSGVTGQPHHQQHQHQYVTVDTPYGALRGFRTPVGLDSYVDRFLAVPFAMPPIGYLRFHKPEPNGPWTGTRDATTLGPQCPQEVTTGDYAPYVTVPMSEDCLYLNVFTPKPPAGYTRPLPVMVWIHGGGYFAGTGSDLDVTQLAAKGIVVVTINYRLGALGFLTTEDAASPGNYGLLDQVRALEWVRDAISAFNGDPNDVTIAGESASSVSLLTLSSRASGLFHKAIIESGTGMAIWAINSPHQIPEPRKIAWRMAAALKCNNTADSVQMVACLKTKSYQDVLNASAEVTADAPGSGVVFSPIAESRFGQYGMFTAEPEVLIRNGKVNVPTLVGFNKDEFGMMPLKSKDGRMTVEQFRNLTRQFVYDNLNQTSHAVDMERIFRLLSDAYAGNTTDPFQLRYAYSQIASDLYIIVPTVKEMQLVQNSSNPVTQYLYRFSFRSANRLNEPYSGVVHADQLHYVMGYPVNNDFLWTHFVSDWTQDDRLVSDNVMTWWSNFVKYGDPTPAGSTAGTRWWPWRQERPQLLDIKLPSAEMIDMPVSPSKLRLWNEIMAIVLSDSSADRSIIGDPAPAGGAAGTRWWPWRQENPQLLDKKLPSAEMINMPLSPSKLQVWDEVIAINALY